MGRLPKRSEPQQPLQSLMPRHRAMARYFAVGARNVEISKLFGMTEGRVSIIANSPLMKAEVRRLQNGMEEKGRDLHKEIKQLAGEALDIVSEDLLTQEKAPARTKLALEVLDRAGLARGSRPEVSQTTTPIQIVINTPGPENPQNSVTSGASFDLKET